VRQQLGWFLIAAIVSTAAYTGEGNASVPDAPLSLGYPNSGRLIGGRRFRETPFMVMVPAHANSRVRWALPALLSVLDRASRIVARKYPGSILEIGELSRRDGGPISSHLSHQNGRDADVGFYQVDLDGEPIRAPKFVRFDSTGTSRDDPTVRFDEKRNWAFVRAVLEDPHFDVRQIFIYAPLRARLLAYAAKVGASRDLRNRAAQAMMQPFNALPHDDHFHIRISCPTDQVDLGCTDLPLWRAPGSPDEFGPDLLVERPRVTGGAEIGLLSRYELGRLSKLWSVQDGLCHKVDLACTTLDPGPACEDLGELGLPVLSLPADEMGAPGTPPADGVPVASVPAMDGDRIEPPVAVTFGSAIGPIENAPFVSILAIPSPEITVHGAEPTQIAEAGSGACTAPLEAIAPYCAPAEETNACVASVAALATRSDGTSSSAGEDQPLNRSSAARSSAVPASVVE
jgi:murein endopeptidase